MADFGYDVSDYTNIDPRFGTMADFDALVAAAHTRGLRVLLDYVPNHTSNQHPWFLESRKSRDNSKRDWYVWRDPGPAGGPPNNWVAVFGGSAWTLDQGPVSTTHVSQGTPDSTGATDVQRRCST
jgi:alpha-glucosidase